VRIVVSVAGVVSDLTETPLFNKNHDSTNMKSTDIIFQGACLYQQFSLPRGSVKHVFISSY